MVIGFQPKNPHRSPPLGIIGLPLTVTGTHDDPQVKLRLNTEDLKEKEYDGEPPAETAAQSETARPSGEQSAP